MKTYRIAVIAGDGVGPEVIAEAVKVLKTAAEIDGRFAFSFTDFPWGCGYYLKTGKMMPDNGLEILKDFDAILLGAVGAPGVPDHISLRGLLLKIRRGFDQYINLRPVRLLEGAPCPLKDMKREDINMTFIRENSEGEYSGTGAWLYKDQPEEVVIQNGVFSRKGCERVIRYAYELAKKEGRTLTSISKANALNYSMVFWDQIFAEVGKDYPEVKTGSCLVDAASMFMVKDPGRFQVVVTSNLFGDILTDLGENDSHSAVLTNRYVQFPGCVNILAQTLHNALRGLCVFKIHTLADNVFKVRRQYFIRFYTEFPDGVGHRFYINFAHNNPPKKRAVTALVF